MKPYKKPKSENIKEALKAYNRKREAGINREEVVFIPESIHREFQHNLNKPSVNLDIVNSCRGLLCSLK